MLHCVTEYLQTQRKLFHCLYFGDCLDIWAWFIALNVCEQLLLLLLLLLMILLFLFSIKAGAFKLFQKSVQIGEELI